ncbi:hypothetical protein KQI42_20225 [Tissierella sp. MSJ-40]|uniref:Uncharacterized protein n=1 Tax=Tissierella simiarum TaxID=2841534 RepID=A0ABS6EBL9_9FIRM|nr:hypothetical protein [Tissierella simiarum]MBU5440326.1 hypothetical protein [Tissierella simiarum]
MKLTFKKIICIIIILFLGVAFALINGWLPISSKNTHPPCDQLPSVAEVTEALADHKSFVKEIESLGRNIQVEVGLPCSDNQDRALIQIKYKSKSEEKAIRNLIEINEGFGVPIHLVKR